MTEPLTAHERLVAPRADTTRRRGPRGTPPSGPKKPRRDRLAWLTRFVGGCSAPCSRSACSWRSSAAVGGYMAYRHYSADLPDVDGLRNYQPPVMSRVFASDGRLLAELATERRIFVPYSAIPGHGEAGLRLRRGPEFLDRTAASIRWRSLRAGGVRPDALWARDGGRSAPPPSPSRWPRTCCWTTEVSLARKARRRMLAMRIEQALTQAAHARALSERDLSRACGSYGVAAAAQAYFNKPLDQLTLPEAAFLAALPKAPNNYNPFRYPDAAKARRDWVLDRMADDHAITAAQAAAAKAQPIIPAQFHRPDADPGRRLVRRGGAARTDRRSSARTARRRAA